VLERGIWEGKKDAVWNGQKRSEGVMVGAGVNCPCSGKTTHYKKGGESFGKVVEKGEEESPVCGEGVAS